MTLPQPPLLAITDRMQARRPLAEVLSAAFAAGCRWASLREKDLPIVEQIALAHSLLPLARRWGARLTIHGDAELAKAADVDGVHLPAGTDPQQTRAVLGSAALIGLSVHSTDDLVAAGLDYAIAGPVYETASKPGYGPAIGPEGLCVFIARATTPIVGIGGITPDRVADVMAAGAAGVAVMGEIMRADDPGATVAALLTGLAQPRPR